MMPSQSWLTGESIRGADNCTTGTLAGLFAFAIEHVPQPPPQPRLLDACHTFRPRLTTYAAAVATSVPASMS